MSRETIGFVMFKEVPDDSKPGADSQAMLAYRPVTADGVPWLKADAKMEAELGMQPVWVIQANVNRVGTKITYGSIDLVPVEGLEAGLKARLEKLAPTVIKTLLDDFYGGLQ
jgi:hypothetical protein